MWSKLNQNWNWFISVKPPVVRKSTCDFVKVSDFSLKQRFRDPAEVIADIVKTTLFDSRWY